MSDNTATGNYKWIDEWGPRDQSEKSLEGWAHPGMATTSDGRIITCDSGHSEILVYSQEGNLIESWPGNFVDAHGLTVSKSDDGTEDALWIADNGSKRLSEYSYEYPPGAENQSGRVFKCALNGVEILTLPKPEHTDYKKSRYSPTSVTVNEVSLGGNGDIWVADGYGASLVHRFSKEGNYLQSIDGTTGSGHFDCPHGIIIDWRKNDPELYVADRANGRIQVFDLQGTHLRTFGNNFMTTPSEFAVSGSKMVVAELEARLTILDEYDQLIQYLFPDDAAAKSEGWPNELASSGISQRPSRLAPKKFNSPHGITVDEKGNIYVAEWLIGGRFTKLGLS
jgi:hypothetical protein